MIEVIYVPDEHAPCASIPTGKLGNRTSHHGLGYEARYIRNIFLAPSLVCFCTAIFRQCWSSQFLHSDYGTGMNALWEIGT